MKLIPLGERVLIKTEVSEDKTKSGLFIPTSAKEKTQMGTIEAIGDDKDIKVKTGQRVMFDKYAGSHIEIEKEEFLIINFKDVIAIVE